MDHVGLGIVDPLQLEFQLQDVPHRRLQKTNRAPAALAPTPGDARSLGCDQFVEHAVVLRKQLVQAFIIVLLGDVHGPNQIHVEARVLTVGRDGNDSLLFGPGHAFRIRHAEPATGEEDAAVDAAGLQAPMNGTIVSLLVAVDQAVEAGESLLVMEAMKMEHTIRAPAAGHVRAFHFNPGDLVEGGASLLDFETE